MPTPSALPRLRRTALALGVALLSLTASSCGTEQFIRSAAQATVTETELQEVGREGHLTMVKAKLIYNEPRLAAYVSRVGQRVALSAQTAGGANNKLLFRFFVLDDPDYNAFAAPGGYIYITRGFLALLNTEDELAAVFGHEIAHVTAGHTLKQANAEGRAGMIGALGSMGLSVLGVLTFNPLLIGLAGAGDVANGVGTALYSQSHSRDHELEADRLGKSYTGLAGYTPGAPERVMNVLESLAKADADAARRKKQSVPAPIWGVFDSHPTNALRINALRAAAAKGQRRAPEADFLSAIDGLDFGISDRVGVQRASTFYSQGHQMVVNVPAGWDAELSSDGSSVAFADDDETAFIYLTSQDLPTRQDATGFANSYFNVGNLAGGARKVASLNAWRGTVTPKRRRGEYASYEGMTWVNGDRGYALVGGRSDKSKLSNAAWINLFDRAASSLRPLRLEEAALAKSIQIRIVAPDAKKPLTYAALAQQNSVGPHTVGTLRLINGQYGTQLEPPKAQRVKVLR